MAWDTSIPLITNIIDNDLSDIRDNWTALETGTVPFDYIQLDKQTSDPSGGGDAYLYTKDGAVSSDDELFFYDGGSNAVQLTTGGLAMANYVKGGTAADLDIVATASKDIDITLGDAAGANNLTIFQSDGTTPCLLIDSNKNLTVYNDTTLTETITAKVGDKGDAAMAINALIPVAWAYYSYSGNAVTNGKNLTAVHGTAPNTNVVTFTFANYTPSAGDYCVVATMTDTSGGTGPSAYIAVAGVSPLTTTTFQVNMNKMTIGDIKTIHTSDLMVAVYDA